MTNIILIVGWVQILIALILSLVFILLPKRHDNLAIAALTFAAIGVYQIIFGAFLWVVGPYGS
jgi:heme/copper-type cytochrome/quinol oxidase subunit 4